MDTMTKLIQNLAQNSKLSHLYVDISHNSVGSRGSELEKALKNVKNFEGLNLGHMGIKSKVGDPIIRTLASVHNLILDGNFDTSQADDICLALGTILQQNPALTKLSLAGGDTVLKDNSLVKFFRHLAKDDTLLYLDISNQHIGDESFIVLCESLYTNSTLTTLKALGNNITVNGYLALKLALKKNKTLKDIDIIAAQYDRVSSDSSNHKAITELFVEMGRRSTPQPPPIIIGKPNDNNTTTTTTTTAMTTATTTANTKLSGNLGISVSVPPDTPEYDPYLFLPDGWYIPADVFDVLDVPPEVAANTPERGARMEEMDPLKQVEYTTASTPLSTTNTTTPTTTTTTTTTSTNPAPPSDAPPPIGSGNSVIPAQFPPAVATSASAPILVSAPSVTPKKRRQLKPSSTTNSPLTPGSVPGTGPPKRTSTYNQKVQEKKQRRRNSMPLNFVSSPEKSTSSGSSKKPKKSASMRSSAGAVPPVYVPDPPPGGSETPGNLTPPPQPAVRSTNSVGNLVNTGGGNSVPPPPGDVPPALSDSPTKRTTERTQSINPMTPPAIPPIGKTNGNSSANSENSTVPPPPPPGDAPTPPNRTHSKATMKNQNDSNEEIKLPKRSLTQKVQMPREDNSEEKEDGGILFLGQDLTSNTVPPPAPTSPPPPPAPSTGGAIPAAPIAPPLPPKS